MGAGASVNLNEELAKPMDASDVATPRGESAKTEVVRLRKMLFDRQRVGRLQNAVLGSIFADAACSSLLWNYDPAGLVELVGDKDPFFFDKAHAASYLKNFMEAGHYTKPGSPSPFGEQSMAYLDTVKSLDATKDMDGQAAVEEFNKWSSTHTGYKEYNVNMFNAAYAEGKKFPDVAPSHMMAEQAEHMTMPALCALKYRDQPQDFQAKQCRTLTQATHKSKWTEELNLFCMKVILSLTDGKKGFKEAVEQAMGEVDADLQSDSLPAHSSIKEMTARAMEKPFTSGVELYEFRKADFAREECKTAVSAAVPQYHPPEETMEAFVKITCINCFSVNGFMIVMNILSHTSDWKEALKLNIMAGGDSAGRGQMLGAFLGAMHGSIPSDLAPLWENKAATTKAVEECSA